MAEFSLTTLTVEDFPEFAEVADRSSATARPASCLVPCGRWRANCLPVPSAPSKIYRQELQSQLHTIWESGGQQV